MTAVIVTSGLFDTQRDIVQNPLPAYIPCIVLPVSKKDFQRLFDFPGR
jgi:hypothetical protein